MQPLIVLAGGFGKRLRSSVSNVPKPLAPVGSIPFISYLIDNWIEEGIEEFIFLLHYEAAMMSSMIKDKFNNGKPSKLVYTIIEEDFPLGTGGATLNAIRTLDLKESFLLANADTWLGKSINLMSGHDPSSVGAVKVSNANRYGSLEIQRNKVCSFLEKSVVEGDCYVNAGIYHLEPNIFKSSNFEKSFSLEEEVLPELAHKGLLNAVILSTEFIDIGVPEDYLRFCDWIKNEKKYEL